MYKKSLQEQIQEKGMEKNHISSKIRYKNFRDDLEEIIDNLEQIISEKITKNYQVHFTEYGASYFKVKIKDKSLMIDKLITCKLSYKGNDEKYGYFTPEFSVTQKGEKTKNHQMKKYSLSEQNNIYNEIINFLIELIEAF